MLEKYLKFFKGGQGAANDAPGAAPRDVTAVLDAATQGGYGHAAAMLQRFLGRQPILDSASQIVGYELKVRDHGLLPDTPDSEAQRQMQDEMLVISVIDLDFQQALGSKLTFISVAPSMLNHPALDQLPKHKVVVGICLPAMVDEALLARCRELVAQGVALALDDFAYRPEYEPFLKICAYVKLDTTRYDALALGQRVAEIQGKATPVMIACNVETQDAFEAYRQLSFSLFQGYYFTHLQPAAPYRLDSDRLRVIELLNLVMNRAELAELEEKVKLDPGLSYKLLNFVNSPANGLQQKIRSIGHVLTLLGYDQLYRWLTLLLFTSGNIDGRSRTLLKSALVRARFTETLGKDRFKPAEQGGLFIVGIFSLLDALLNVPMEQALARLNLPQAVVDALVRQSGVYAPYLQLALACENFDQDTIARCATACGLNADAVNVTHVNALIWGEGLDA
ncbi:MAG: HDOD domain-containing protein [Sulfurimicrobium sp.]|nr:HDOD domain-containing protein [Sulfurimicrobium sp.]